MTTKNIHQDVTFKAAPKEIYRALMDSKTHSKITGSKAVIGTKVGSFFSVWGGGVSGITLALEPNKKIVQAWRTGEWEENHYSVAVFELVKANVGTKLIFDHYAVPADDYKTISDNWKACYWTPMKEMFATNSDK